MLILSLAALLAGPVLFGLAGTQPRAIPALELLIITAITVLVVLELAPLATGGAALAVLPATALGLFGPTAVEWILHRIDYHRVEARAHQVTMLVGLSGLGTHAFVDGAALTGVAASSAGMLAGAVVLHRVPVGLAVWWIARPVFGPRVAWGLLGLIGASTLAGYAAGTRLLPTLSLTALAAFQGFVAGSLLHVVFFHKHVEAHGPQGHSSG